MKNILFITALFQAVSFQTYNQAYGFGSTRKVDGSTVKSFVHDDCIASVYTYFELNHDLLRLTVKNDLEKKTWHLVDSKDEHSVNIALADEKPDGFQEAGRCAIKTSLDMFVRFERDAKYKTEVWRRVIGRIVSNEYDCMDSEARFKTIQSLLEKIPSCNKIQGSLQEHQAMQKGPPAEKVVGDPGVIAEEVRY